MGERYLRSDPSDSKGCHQEVKKDPKTGEWILRFHFHA